MDTGTRPDRDDRDGRPDRDCLLEEPDRLARAERFELGDIDQRGARADVNLMRAGGALGVDLGRWRYIIAAFALVLGLVSFFLLAPWASSPETHASTISVLDAKKSTVTALMGSSTATSAAITLLPGDVATPISEKLVDLSADFLIVLAAIYLEKYLLTTMGFIAFKILVPLGCALLLVGVLAARERFWNPVADFGTRLVIFAVAAFMVVPASTFLSSMIESTYEAQIQETITTAQQTAEQIEQQQDEGATSGSTTDTTGADATTSEDEQPAPNLIEMIQGVPQAIQQSVTEGVTGITEEAQRSLNNFIDALAVMIVTSCVIPILVLLCFLWLAKAIFGLKLDMPNSMFRTIHGRR
jgi:hypothetical protein